MTWLPSHQEWENILQAMTLFVTLYFTRQLVKNDNQRERRVAYERAALRCTHAFKMSLAKDEDSAKRTIRTIAKHYPFKFALLMDSYQRAIFKLEEESKPIAFIPDAVITELFIEASNERLANETAELEKMGRWARFKRIFKSNSDSF